MSRSAPVPPALRAALGPAGSLLWGTSTGRILLGRQAGALPAGALPPALADLEAAFVQARFETSPPLSERQVGRALRAAWGAPAAEVLDELDLGAPVASTPLAQVHRGMLAGEAVAVKVRRPGVEATTRADRAVLDAVRTSLGIDASGAAAGVLSHLLDAVDLEHEAAQRRAVARALRATPGVVVPTTHGDLCTPSVLVSAWLPAPTVAAARPADPLRTARALVAAHLTAARSGLLLTDTRPNHVLVLEDGTVGLLGSGAVPIDRAWLAQRLALLSLVADDDPGRFAEAAGRLLPDGGAARAAHGLLRDVLGALVRGTARLDAAALAALLGRALAREHEARALAAACAPAPGDLALAWSAGQLVAVLAALGAEDDWLALIAPQAG